MYLTGYAAILARYMNASCSVSNIDSLVSRMALAHTLFFVALSTLILAYNIVVAVLAEGSGRP